MQTTAFRLRCLGPAMLLGSDEARVSFETRKHLVLLYYMARHPGRPISRDELTDLFWHGDEEKKARHSLSHAVSLINKSMRAEAIVVVSAGRLMLPEGVVDLDVRDFEKLVAEGRFIQARELWNGRLFEGYWIPRAPKLEEWLAVERGRLERVFRRVLHELIEDHRAAGDHEMMRREAEALLDLDELDEKAMLGYLEALSLLGDRTLALRRYSEFEKRIAGELDAEPSSNLKAWAKRTRRADAPVSLPTKVGDSTVLPAPQRIYGRDSEFTSLWTHWERARSGIGTFVILEGPAGIGKSALAAKVANQVHVTGGAVCFVKCYRTDKAVPFAPITGLVRQLSRLPGFVAMGGAWISELTRLYPELRQRFPEAPQPMAIDDSARLRICDATIEALRSVSDEQPIMVLIEDVPDADEASLALIHYVGRQVKGLPIALLCTVRTEANWGEVERMFLTTARAAQLASFLHVRPLPDAEIARLAAQVLAHRGVHYSESLIGDITAVAQGNPLLAVEASMGTSTSPSGELEIPRIDQDSGFGAASVDRLRDLSADSQLVVSALVMSGRPLSEYELAVVTKLGPAELASAVDSLERGNFAKRHGSELALAHERYVECVNSLMASSTRQTLHNAFAAHLSATASRNPSSRFELATHLKGAGKTREARRQALAAADYAASIGALKGKAEALELAVSLQNMPSAKDLIELGRCYVNLNDLCSLDSLAERMRHKPSLARDAQYFRIASDLQAGRISLDLCSSRLQCTVKNETSFSTEAEALLMLLRVADKTFEYSVVKEVARRLRRKHSESFKKFATAYLYVKYYWADCALLAMEEALRVSRAERNWPVEQLSRDGLAIALKQVGRYRDSIRQFDFSLGLARKTLNPHAEMACLNNRAVTEMCMGDHDKMRATHSEAERVAPSTSTAAFSRYRIYNDAMARLTDGELDAAEHGFKTCHELSLRSGIATLAAESSAGLALVAQRRGDLAGLQRSVSDVRRLAPSGDRMTLSWIETAAIAHDEAMNGAPLDGEAVIAATERRCRSLYRRDISFWLALRLETIRLKEAVRRVRETNERAELARDAGVYQAAGVQRAAAET